MNHRFQKQRDGIEGVGAVFRQPFDEAGDVLAQGYFLINKHGSERPHARDKQPGRANSPGIT
ncbi:hypothetical protein THH46_29220 [Pseudomonas sp. NA13]